MRNRFRLLLTILLTAAVGGGAWYYVLRDEPQQAAILTLYGNVDIREVQPAFNASGQITEILVEEGAKVKAGELLAVLDDTRYVAALAEAKAVAAAARVTYLNKEANYKRSETLAESGTGSQQKRDDDKAALDAARASYDAAVAAVAAVALAEDEFEDTRLYAPSDGVIEDRILQPGDMASPSSPVFTIALPSPLWVRTYVPEKDVGLVQLNQVATIETDSYPGHVYRGWVGYLSPTAEFTPKTVETPELRTALVYQLRVFVCDGLDELRLGMPATVHIDLEQTAGDGHPGCDGDHASGS